MPMTAWFIPKKPLSLGGVMSCTISGMMARTADRIEAFAMFAGSLIDIPLYASSCSCIITIHGGGKPFLILENASFRLQEDIVLKIRLQDRGRPALGCHRPNGRGQVPFCAGIAGACLLFMQDPVLLRRRAGPGFPGVCPRWRNRHGVARDDPRFFGLLHGLPPGQVAEL